MPNETVSSVRAISTDRLPPYSEEAERGVLGSIMLDSSRVMDLCIENQLSQESFYVPAHSTVYMFMLEVFKSGSAVDLVTLSEALKAASRLEDVGGVGFLERIVDSTPTSAHAEYYIDIVRQRHLLRCIIACARDAEKSCYRGEENADHILGQTEQAFMEITERQHGFMLAWQTAVKETMEHVEEILSTHRGLSGISTGFVNLDSKIHGLRPGEMIVLAARPSMGKTSLAMNIAERVALGIKDPDKKPRPVGIFSLEMAHEALVLRMLCSHAKVSAFKLSSGCVSATVAHPKLTTAASVLSKAPIYLDDTGGLDVVELRARARRMKKKYDIEFIMIDYLQLLHSKEYARQGRQIETANISGNLKAMAKELRIPVLVLSQLSRAPEQRDKVARPKLSDLRDSGAIEQDADVVCMLRRPCKYPDDEERDDEMLSIVDVVKQRNGPTGEIRLNFEEEYVRFEDRKTGVDGAEEELAGGVADADVVLG